MRRLGTHAKVQRKGNKMVRLWKVHALLSLAGLLVGACGSFTESEPVRRSDVVRDGSVGGADRVPDSPLPDVGPSNDGSDGARVLTDGEPNVDAPELPDGAAVTVDGSPDAWLIGLPDGRTLQVVDYCPDIRPLSLATGDNGVLGCPASFQEALLLTTTDAGSPYPWPPARLGRCSEGTWFLVFGNLGGLECFYRSESQQLFAAARSSDTLQPCPASNLVSFVSAVYGEKVRCTNWVFFKPDGGAGPTPPAMDASVESDGGTPSTLRDATRVQAVTLTAAQAFMQPSAPFLLQADISRTSDGRFTVNAKMLVSLSGCSGEACNRQVTLVLSRDATTRVEGWLAVIPGQACHDDPGPVCDFGIRYAIGIDGAPQNQTCCKLNEWGQNSDVTGLHGFLQDLVVGQLGPLDGGSG